MLGDLAGQFGVVDQLAHGAALGVERIDQGLNLVHQQVICSMETSLVRITSWMLGEPEAFSSALLAGGGPVAWDGADIDVAVAQHAGLGDGGGRIGVQIVEIFAAHPHGHLDRRGIAVRDHADVDHVADGDALERDRRAVLEPRGILKVGAQHELARKQPARRAGHEKNQPDQHGHGHQDQSSHSQLRPLNLFAAWHGTPLAEMSR